MLATVLKSNVAVTRAIKIVRGFTLVEKKVNETPLPPTPALKSLVEEAETIAGVWMRMGKKFGTPAHIANFEAAKAARAKTSIDFEPLLLASFHQDNIKPDGRMLEPADLARERGIEGAETTRGKVINSFLEYIGWQFRPGKKRPWEATKEGDKHCTPHSWSRGGKSGYNLKWKVSVVKPRWDQERGLSSV